MYQPAQRALTVCQRRRGPWQRAGAAVQWEGVLAGLVLQVQQVAQQEPEVAVVVAGLWDGQAVAQCGHAVSMELNERQQDSIRRL